MKVEIRFSSGAGFCVESDKLDEILVSVVDSILNPPYTPTVTDEDKPPEHVDIESYAEGYSRATEDVLAGIISSVENGELTTELESAFAAILEKMYPGVFDAEDDDPTHGDLSNVPEEE